MSATAVKSTKRRFSSLNHQNFEFFRLVPRSPTHTGLICGKTLEPNISSLGPFKLWVISVICSPFQPLQRRHSTLFCGQKSQPLWWRLSTLFLCSEFSATVTDSLKSLLCADVSGTGVEVLNSLFCAEIHQM